MNTMLMFGRMILSKTNVKIIDVTSCYILTAALVSDVILLMEMFQTFFNGLTTSNGLVIM